MLNKLNPIKATALTLAASMLTATMMPVSVANAHDRHRAHNGGHGHYHNQQAPRRKHNQQRRNKNGDLIAAGIIGLAIGAIVINESNKRKQRRNANTYVQPKPQYRQPAKTYYQEPKRSYYQEPTRYQEPVRSYNEPQVISYDDEFSLEPWTPGWSDWCDNKYRSFNPATGTFRGYDGKDHFCVPK